VKETLLSVGIDIGTSTTQLVLSRLTLVNRANPFSIPRIAIDQKEILYRSQIHFTPLLDERTIDAAGVAAIVSGEYQKANILPDDIDTGAVIITGETARKENARQVVSALAGMAGDFVVATAGPDLESILAARGAGADLWSEEHHASVLNFDIGGGTSNLALYERGALKSTGCMDIGGRLIKYSPSGEITYITPPLERRFDGVVRGARATPELLRPVIEEMVQALAQAAGLFPPSELLEFYTTAGTTIPRTKPAALSFSGGVADCVFQPPADWRAYGDIGVLLGRAIVGSPAFQGIPLLKGSETIRATVVGAGAHSMEVSGSTIYYRQVEFPLKNLPIVKLGWGEELGSQEEVEAAIGEKLRWHADEGGLSQVALGLAGLTNPSYEQVGRLAKGVARGLQPLLAAGHFPILVVEADMAKVLGQALSPLVPGPLLCLDGVGVENGDYIDIGTPVAGGTVLPVVIKTLVFAKE
jgi:ethanolamine utilization protein EutA